jgi:hypothetical protein
MAFFVQTIPHGHQCVGEVFDKVLIPANGSLRDAPLGSDLEFPDGLASSA